MTESRRIEIALEIQTRKPINPDELAEELTEAIKKECPELVDFKVKVTTEPAPLTPS